MEEPLEALETLLGVRFQDAALLRRALTHKSAAVEGGIHSNERLEFLGDSVVGLVVCDNLYRLYPKHSEGDLAKSKAVIVSEPILADAAYRLGLDPYLNLSDSEAAAGGRRRRSILSDAFEAIVAAVFLDGGMEPARRLVERALDEALHTIPFAPGRSDHKSVLQEEVQARVRITPIYRIVGEEGQEHDRTFIALAVVGNRVLSEGRGKSKKEAEQAAAKRALEELHLHFPEYYGAKESSLSRSSGYNVRTVRQRSVRAVRIRRFARRRARRFRSG